MPLGYSRNTCIVFCRFCIDIVTTTTANSAREPAYVKLLYVTSDESMDNRQIPRPASRTNDAQAGVTKPHLTTPTRTHDKNDTEYATNTGHAIDRTCKHAAGGRVAGVLRSHRGQLPAGARPTRIDMHARQARIHANAVCARTCGRHQLPTPHVSSGPPLSHGTGRADPALNP